MNKKAIRELVAKAIKEFALNVIETRMKDGTIDAISVTSLADASWRQALEALDALDRAEAAKSGMVDVRCDRCGKPHFEGDCTSDPNYEKTHVVAPPADHIPDVTKMVPSNAKSAAVKIHLGKYTGPPRIVQPKIAPPAGDVCECGHSQMRHSGICGGCDSAGCFCTKFRPKQKARE